MYEIVPFDRVARVFGAPRCGAGRGQVSAGEIFGKVTDTTGAVLPGATVTITSPALIQSQSVVTAASGGYRFPNLPVGTYAVSVDLMGFKKTVLTDVLVQAGFNAEINAKLDVSTVQETVTVSGVSPIVDTKSNTLGTNFGKDLLDAIPSARDPWVIRVTRQDASNGNFASTILAPRIVRFGLKVNF